MNSARWPIEFRGECRGDLFVAGEYGGDGYARSGFSSVVVAEVSFGEAWSLNGLFLLNRLGSDVFDVAAAAEGALSGATRKLLLRPVSSDGSGAVRGSLT